MTAETQTGALRALLGPWLGPLRLPARWLARQEAFVLLTAFGIVVTLYGFVEIVEEMLDSDGWHFDEWLLRLLRRHDDPAVPIGPAWLVDVTVEITALGGTAVLVVILVFTLGYL